MRSSQGLGVEIVVDGQVLPEYEHNGKTYIAAPPNSDYQIRFVVPTIPGHRHPCKRFQAVTFVDGLDIWTGQEAKSEAGSYVITPPDEPTSNDVPGFRLDEDEVAAFHFGDRQDACAAQLGKPQNIGVIDVTYYSERDPAPEPLRSAGHGRGCGDMGTAHGDRIQHHVEATDGFDAEEQVARFSLEYASYDSLVQRGIIAAPTT